MPCVDLSFGPMHQALAGVQEVTDTALAPQGLGIGSHGCPQTFQALVNETRIRCHSVFHSFAHLFIIVKYLLSAYSAKHCTKYTVGYYLWGEGGGVESR